MPNQAFTSFTRTWIEFFKGNIAADDLKTGLFKFACTREHLFPSGDMFDAIGNTYPAEITWARPNNSQHERIRGAPTVNTGRVPASLISDDVEEKFCTFLSIISDRDLDGCVIFRDDEAGGVSSDAIVTRRWKAIVEHIRRWEV